VAIGVRAAQRLIVTGEGQNARVSFADPGGWVADELNSVAVADLMRGSPAPNFGWGRTATGRSREGTFFIDRVGSSVERIASPEASFIDPVTEIGRGRAALFALSGPVASSVSFRRIAMLFGDLVSGAVFAIMSPPETRRQQTFAVTLVNDANQTITLQQLANGIRPDPRFFTFPDGSAGVLLERTGEFFRLTEIQKPNNQP
jgi:hypothetical protein